MLFNYKKYLRLFALSKTLGFSLVELLVALGAFAILASGVIYVVTNSYSNFYGTGDKQVLAEFAQEALEAVRSIRENSWQYLEDNTGTNLGLTQTNGVWSFAGTSNTRGDFTRAVSISDAQRDSDGNLVLSGGIADPLTKKITVTVSAAGLEDYVLTSYLTSWANRVWEQTDWSGSIGAQYWSDQTKVYSSSSIDGVSAPGALILSPGTAGGTTWDWQDLTDLASSTGSLAAYATAVDDGSDYWYWCGSSSSFRRFHIADIRSTGFGANDSLYTAGCRSIVINPVYPHVYTGHAYGVVRTISTTTHSVLQTFTPATTVSGFSYSAAISADGTNMYFGGSGGYLYSFSIAADGILTCENCNASDVPQQFSGDVIGTMWLDDAADMLYIGTDSITNAMMKINVSNPANLASAGYVYSNTVDFTDISYVGTNDLGQNRFVVGTDYSASLAEFYVIDDTGSAFLKVAELDLSAIAGTTINVKDIFYTGNNEAFVMAVDVLTPFVQLFTISGVTGAATPPVASDLRSADFYGYSTLSYHPTAYSPKHGGIFVGWTYGDSSTSRSTFIEQASVSAPAGYAATGNLISSIIDLGSADQELHSLSITQDVPSSCADDALRVTLQADDNVSFSSPSSQVFSSSTVSTFSTEIDSALSSQRWLRYQVDMSNCSSGAETPTLYSVRLNYR